MQREPQSGTGLVLWGQPFSDSLPPARLQHRPKQFHQPGIKRLKYEPEGGGGVAFHVQTQGCLLTESASQTLLTVDWGLFYQS